MKVILDKCFTFVKIFLHNGLPQNKILKFRSLIGYWLFFANISLENPELFAYLQKIDPARQALKS